MAWLNLRSRELEFHNDEEGWYDGAGIFSECYLPFRESFRTREIVKQGWDFRDYNDGQRIGDVTPWKYASMVIENNIGKPFDKAYSYFLRKTKHIWDRHYWFLNDFDVTRRFPEYCVDENGNIQFTQSTLEWRKRHQNKEPYTFKSADYDSVVVNKTTFEKMDMPSYPYWIEKTDRVKKIQEDAWNKYRANSITVIKSGYYVENVQPNSKLEKRLRREYNQKKKQMNKQYEIARKNKEYSFLTREEEALKKSKLEDLWKLEKAGFDSESFKGEPYHGRKNKKK